MSKKTKVGSMLQGLSEKEKEVKNSSSDIDEMELKTKEKMVDVLCNMQKAYTYSLPMITDAILEVIKSETGKGKSSILSEIIINNVDNDTIKKAKARILSESGV